MYTHTHVPQAAGADANTEDADLMTPQDVSTCVCTYTLVYAHT